jgi:hypothetical protein
MSGCQSVLSRAGRVRRRPLRSLSARAASTRPMPGVVAAALGHRQARCLGWPGRRRSRATPRPVARRPRRCGSRIVAASEAPGPAVSTEPTHAPAAMHRASEPPGHGPGAATSSQRRLAGGARQRGPAVRGRLRVYLGVAPRGRRDLHAAAGGARARCPRRLSAPFLRHMRNQARCGARGTWPGVSCPVTQSGL